MAVRDHHLLIVGSERCESLTIMYVFHRSRGNRCLWRLPSCEESPWQLLGQRTNPSSKPRRAVCYPSKTASRSSCRCTRCQPGNSEPLSETGRRRVSISRFRRGLPRLASCCGQCSSHGYSEGWGTGSALWQILFFEGCAEVVQEITGWSTILLQMVVHLCCH